MRLAAVFALLLTGCATLAPREAPGQLAGSRWTVTEIGGSRVLPNSRPTLAFSEDGRASGEASCNRFGADYRQNGQSLTFGKVATTRRACLPAVMQQEEQFVAVLEAAQQQHIDDAEMVISGPRGGMVMVPETQAPAMAPVRFACEDGASFEVVFLAENARLTDAAGHTVVMVGKPVASGMHYAGQGQELRGKGPELTWTEKGKKPHACREAG